MIILIQLVCIDNYLCKILCIGIIYKMLTVSNLALRQKQAIKNIDETFRQVKRQPVGGYGALIQESNQTPIKQNVTPTLFNPTPMCSSLPYLADHSKFRSNINELLIKEHINIQRENRKAQLDFDGVQFEKQVAKDIEMKMIENTYSPKIEDMLRSYLVAQNKKSITEEVANSENAMKSATARQIALESVIQDNQARQKDLIDFTPRMSKDLIDFTPRMQSADAIELESIIRGDQLRRNEEKAKKESMTNIMAKQIEEINKSRGLERSDFLRKLKQQREEDLRSELSNKTNKELREMTGSSDRDKFNLVSKVLEKIKKGTLKIGVRPDLSEKRYRQNEARLNSQDGGGLVLALKGIQ